MFQDVSALILAGGLGTRLKPLTDRMPKCLVEIAGHPLLQWWDRALQKAGVQEAWVNAHAHAEQVHAWVQEQTGDSAVRWRVFDEPTLLGSAGTLKALLPELERRAELLVIYGDNLSAIDLADMIRCHRKGGHPFTIAVHEVLDPESKGVLELDADGRVISFEEKPAQPRSNLVNAGVYVVSRGAFASVHWEGAFDLAHDILPQLMGQMVGYRLDGYHRDIGTPEALAAAQEDVAAGRIIWPSMAGDST